MTMNADELIRQAQDEREVGVMLAQRAADWFLNRQGEMFERHEAIEELERELDADEDMVGRALGELCGDQLDPVQQIRRSDGAYVGVIHYEEHDVWYEFTQYSVTEGKVRRGVCAQCVKESETHMEPAHVAEEPFGEFPKGATTQDFHNRIMGHFEEEHGGTSVEDVQVGATLVSTSQTTAGDSFFHQGNDGPGSALDSDLLDGEDSGSFTSRTASDRRLAITRRMAMR